MRNTYCVFWKDPLDPDLGTIWLWAPEELLTFAGFRIFEAGIPLRPHSHRPQLIQARGVNWVAIWEDGTAHKFKASPLTTKKVIANIALRWKNPPEKLQKGTARPFDLASLIEESHSHVYLVRLLTFDPTADGRAYYKIGKAVSIPKRIKQFGPCQLVEEARFPTEAFSLQAEKELHVLFDRHRRPETEIFCLNAEQLTAVQQKHFQLLASLK
jgi:hypothetical protein